MFCSSLPILIRGCSFVGSLRLGDTAVFPVLWAYTCAKCWLGQILVCAWITEEMLKELLEMVSKERSESNKECQRNKNNAHEAVLAAAAAYAAAKDETAKETVSITGALDSVFLYSNKTLRSIEFYQKEDVSGKYGGSFGHPRGRPLVFLLVILNVALFMVFLSVSFSHGSGLRPSPT